MSHSLFFRLTAPKIPEGEKVDFDVSSRDPGLHSLPRPPASGFRLSLRRSHPLEQPELGLPGSMQSCCDSFPDQRELVREHHLSSLLPSHPSPHSPSLPIHPITHPTIYHRSVHPICPSTPPATPPSTRPPIHLCVQQTTSFPNFPSVQPTQASLGLTMRPSQRQSIPGVLTDLRALHSLDSATRRVPL